MATIAQLNQVASRTPNTHRKRPRTSDLQDATPSKRRAVEDKVQQHIPSISRSTGRRSATRLPSRSSLTAATPAPKPRGPDVYQLQVSPNQDGEPEKLKGKPRDQKKDPKKKRHLNRRVDKEPGAKEGFDKSRKSTAFASFDLQAVNLDSIDSPAKNTRAKRTLKLKKLDPNFLKPIPLDAEPGREASPELETVTLQERPPPSAQPTRRNDELESEDDAEETDQNDEPQRLSAAVNETDHTDNEDEYEVADANQDTAEEEAPVAQGPSWTQRITDQDRNYMAREQEKITKQKQQEAKESQAKRPDATSKDQANGSRTTDRPAAGHRIQREQVDEEEHTDEENEEQHNEEAEPKKKKGRSKMTEEEKQAKKEAAAKQKEDNARETEAAEASNFEARGERFTQGIEDLADQVGGLKSWHNLGAGAKTITEMVAKKRDMDTARARSLWTKLCYLQDTFSDREEADEELISQAIKSLREKSTWAVLTREGTTGRGDTTIIDLYEHLIPQAVYVLKKALKERFVATYKSSWRELQNITEITISLCDVAADWDPKPSNLESGIRGQVRRHIRPNLASILNAIKQNLKQIEGREKEQRYLAEFAKRQQQNKEERIRHWERMQSECSARHLPRPAGYVPSIRSSQQVMDEPETEELYTAEVQHLTSNSAHRNPPKPSLRRQETEEIPAPDPNTIWSEKENVALLNGLQKYLNEDRYARILKDRKYAKALREKDVDQCMARAKFYKAGCSQILREAAEGDGSFDWLRTV